MKCNKCGKEFDEGKFCPQCGSEIVLKERHIGKRIFKIGYFVLWGLFQLSGLLAYSGCGTAFDGIIEIITAECGFLVIFGVPYLLVTNFKGIRDELPLFNKHKMKLNIVGGLITYMVISILCSIIIFAGNALHSEQYQIEYAEYQEKLETERLQKAKAKEEEKKEAEAKAKEEEVKKEDEVKAKEEESKKEDEKKSKISKEEMEQLPIYSSEYLLAYIDYYEIEVPKRLGKDKMEKALSMDKEAISLKLSGDDQIKYAATSEDSEYFYVGEMKDNKPHGIGKIMKIMSAVEYESELGVVLEFGEYYYAEDETQLYAVLVYAGEFEDGYYDGYGWEFITPFTNSDDVYNSIYSRNLGDNYVNLYDDIASNILATCNPIQYMGQFEKGLYSGEGVKIRYPIREIPFGMSESEIEDVFGYRVDRELVFDIGEFKKGELNGKVKQYLKGHLYYEGIMDDGVIDKEGTLYYMGTDQKQYEGEWRNGYYHGKGTFYSEDGNVIYSGKWDMGDYAN